MSFLVRMRFQTSRILKLGILGILRRVLRKFFTGVFSILLFPISILFYLLGIRRLCIFTDRIGHLAIEPDTLLKAQHLGLIEPRHWWVVAPKNRVANQHLMQYWQRYFTVVYSPLYCFLFNALSLWPFMRYDVSHFINNNKGSQFVYEINKRWGNKPPVLTLTEADQRFADEQFALLGLPKNAWFVCVHVREGGFSPVDEVLHSHRNGCIENTIPAIEEITRRGGWVVRMGDPTMVPLKPLPKVIDYAHHALRSHRMDVILCAKARFILGNTSGLFLVGSAFGVPSALANMIPMPTLGCCPNDISIPKLYRRQLSQPSSRGSSAGSSKNKYISFKKVMQSDISIYRYASLYEKNNIIVEENSPEDILALTIEMLDRLEGKFIETDEIQKLHDKYMSFFEPKHYSYSATSKISFKFLERHRCLIEDV